VQLSLLLELWWAQRLVGADWVSGGLVWLSLWLGLWWALAFLTFLTFLTF